MDHHSSRRVRSPPFGYDSRPMMNMREMESPYNPYGGPRQHPTPPDGCLETPLMAGPPDGMGHPFMDHMQRHSYPATYRDNRLPSTYRQTIRDPYPDLGPPSRSNSPSYKILCLSNINDKIDDITVKNALMGDFCRFGDISVTISHESDERLAYIHFRSCGEARDARIAKTRTLFFDRPLDIEPIYDQDGSPKDGLSPQNPHPMGPQQPMYSPRDRQSMTPPDYALDLNGPSPHHRRQTIPVHIPPPHVATPPIPMNHRTMSPSDYPIRQHPGYGSHGPSPSPMAPDSVPAAFDRRGGYNSGYPPPNHISPYSSPLHDPYRTAYPTNHLYGPYPYHPTGSMPQPSSSIGRSGRDRVYESTYLESRSPHGADPYYMSENRGALMAPHPYPSRSSVHYSPHHRGVSPGPHSVSRTAQYHHSPGPFAHRPPSPPYHNQPHPYPRSRPDPPKRFMSREYRRERLGISDGHGNEHDDGRPSRVLLVNNIDSCKNESDLRDMFGTFGLIEEIEIKKVTPQASSALMRFSSMDGAYKAKTANQGRYIGSSKCSIVYGKVSASRRLWIGGLSSSTTVVSLEDECSKYGDLVNLEYTSGRPYSYVEYETPNQAQFAAYHLRSALVPAPDRKIRIEFVDPERSEKMSRHDANSQNSETKSRTTNESWASNDHDTSPQSVVGRKRSVSPPDASLKRVCHANDLPPGANTFKQERLAAAAKARSTSTASSLTERSVEVHANSVELNNNSTNQAGNGNLGTTDSKSLSNHSSTRALNSEAPNIEILAKCSSIKDLVSNCPTTWPGLIALRNFTFPSKIHLLSGRKQLIDKYLSKPDHENGGVDRSSYPLLKITQRWRLHPQPKLEEVKRRMQSGNHGILLIIARQETNVVSNALIAPECASDDLASIDQQQQQQKQQLVQNGEDSKSREKMMSTDSETTHASCARDMADPTLDDGGSGGTHAATNNESSVRNLVKTNSSPASMTTSKPPQTSIANTQLRPLRNLISYLEQKDAAGVISLSASEASLVARGGQTGAGVCGSTDGNSKLLYVFPPGEFALNLIKHMASNLSTEISKEEFLVGVIVGNNVEAKG